MTKRDLGLLFAIVLVGAVAFAGLFMGLASLRQEVPGEVVILPAATPADEIAALGYESHFTGMFVEDWMGAEPQPVLEVTDGCVITPTGTFQPVNPTENATCTLAIDGALGRYTGVVDTRYTAGSMLILENESLTYTLIITEGTTGAFCMDCDVYVGCCKSTALLWFDGDYWKDITWCGNFVSCSLE